MFEEYKLTKPAILIKRTLDIIFPPESVFEVRIPKTKYGTISGYFNDTAIAAALIAKENGKHPAIYVTANPVQPELHARNANKFEYGSFTTTVDAEITERRWFLIDLDPIRPAGISSSESELALAKERALDVKTWLSSLGWPEPLEATSGNGAHLMYRTDAPNDEAARSDFECATKMIASIFTDDKISVDTTVWNAGRVWKIYGTVAAKGSSTPERPHRVAMWTGIPKDILPVSRDLINALAEGLKTATADEYRDSTGEFIADMQKWLTDRGMSVTSGPRPLYGTEGKKWTISKCPFNPNHEKPIVGLVNNRPLYRCLHNSCATFKWKEFREKIDPTFMDPETVESRLAAWCNSDAEVIDHELVQTACRLGKKLDPVVKKLKKEAPRARVLLLEDFLKAERRRYNKEVLGDGNEKGNIIGLMNRTRSMQEEGILPMYWIADFDHRIRTGDVGDVAAPKVSEADELTLLTKFHSSGDVWVKQIHCSQVIKLLAENYRINPLKKYLQQFRWDGVKRIDSWLVDYAGAADNVYVRAVGRKWLMSAVARGMDPGCQADHMLILEGNQGIGKSRILRALGGPHYTEFTRSMVGPSAHKDMVHVIVGKLIVEMSELATIRRADIESLKAMLTTTVDDVRLSYERDSKAYPRTCVFSGTTNEVGGAYIADLTGARRFWPVHVGEVGPMKVERLVEDRDQLWAEAVEAYESGEDWWTVPAEETLREQLSRQITIESSDPWFDLVRRSLTDVDCYANQCWEIRPEYKNGTPSGKYIIRAGSHSMILGIVLGIESGRQTPGDSLRLRNIFRAIGFKKTRPSKPGPNGVWAHDLVPEANDALHELVLQTVKVHLRISQSA